MKTLRVIQAIAVAVLFAAPADAGGGGVQSFHIDFKNSTDAKTKATWSDTYELGISDDGLGWDGEEAAFRDGWIQTVPMALALSWKPAYSASVHVWVLPSPKEVLLASGQVNTPHVGDVYVRYSPDHLHWSTWQALEAREPHEHDEKEDPGVLFSGAVKIPQSETNRYRKLLSEYAQLDVPWKSDEDAAVRWMVEREPDFFANQLPFIGYLQFRYELEFHGGQRLSSFRATAAYATGVPNSQPKDKNAYKDRDSKPWSFRAEPPKKDAEPGVGADSR